jgi:hypothetical protein
MTVVVEDRRTGGRQWKKLTLLDGVLMAHNPGNVHFAASRRRSINVYHQNHTWFRS